MTRLTLWLRSFPHWVAVAMMTLATVFLLFSGWLKRTRDQREAELEERLRVTAVERDSLRRVAGRRDTVYQRDTVRLRVTETRWRTVVDSLIQTDTLTLRDSVLIATADTTIRACRSALATCEQRIRDRDLLLTNERRTRATADSLFRVRLSQANPRFLPYAEGLVNPFDSRVVAVRGGLEMRFLGPIRLTTAAEYRSHTDTPFALLAGVRVTF